MSREGNGTGWRAMLLLHHVDSVFPRERESLAFTRGQDHWIGRRVVVELRFDSFFIFIWWMR